MDGESRASIISSRIEINITAPYSYSEYQLRSNMTREEKIAYAKDYYRQNHKILAKKREKEADPKVKEKLKEYLSRPEVLAHRKAYTQRKRLDVQYRQNELATASNKRVERRRLLNDVQMHYGCRNPGCEWIGSYFPEILDFHHFNPETKNGQISLMISHKTAKVAAEVNKCVILCRNCHALYHSGKVQLDESMLCQVNERWRFNDYVEK